MSDRNVEIVRIAYDAFSRGDIDTLLGVLDPDVEWVTPGPESLPIAGTRRGREAVRGFFATIASTFEFERFAPHTFIAQGDHVVVLGDDTVRIKATGTRITEAWAHVMTVKNDKVVAFREYMDMTSVANEFRQAAARV